MLDLLRSARNRRAWRHVAGTLPNGTNVNQSRISISGGVRDFSGYRRLRIGSDSLLQCRLALETDYSSISIGDRTYIGGGSVISAAESVSIGNDVLVSFDVLIFDHDSHSTVWEGRAKDVVAWKSGTKDWTNVRTGRVEVGDKAWLGARSIILKGVIVGEGAIVGAGAVVTRDVDPWTMVAGAPARCIGTSLAE